MPVRASASCASNTSWAGRGKTPGGSGGCGWGVGETTLTGAALVLGGSMTLVGGGTSPGFGGATWFVPGAAGSGGGAGGTVLRDCHHIQIPMPSMSNTNTRRKNPPPPPRRWLGRWYLWSRGTDRFSHKVTRRPSFFVPLRFARLPEFRVTIRRRRWRLAARGPPLPGNFPGQLPGRSRVVTNAVTDKLGQGSDELA